MRKWIIASVCALLLAVIGALLWYAIPQTETFYTDADTIREPHKSVVPRDILWKPPIKLKTSRTENIVV